MGLFTTIPPSILPPARQSAGSTGSNTAQVQAVARGTPYEQLAVLLGQSDRTLQNQIDTIMSALRSPLPQPATYYVTNPSGAMIAWLGYRVVSGVTYQALWANQAYFGGTDPTNAPIIINGTSVTINGATQIIVTNGAVKTTIGAGGVLVQVIPGPYPASQIATSGIQLFDSSGNIVVRLSNSGVGSIDTVSYNINGTPVVYKSGSVLTAALDIITATQSIAAGTGYLVGATTIVDSSRNGIFLTVNVTGGYKYNGTAGLTSNTTYADGNVTTTTLQYKDWGGTNQSLDVVTAITHRTISVGGGIITAI